MECLAIVWLCPGSKDQGSAYIFKMWHFSWHIWKAAPTSFPHLADVQICWQGVQLRYCTDCLLFQTNEDFSMLFRIAANHKRIRAQYTVAFQIKASCKYWRKTAGMFTPDWNSGIMIQHFPMDFVKLRCFAVPSLWLLYTWGPFC